MIALLAAGAAAQAPAPEQPEPVALVGQAERLLAKKEPEDAILALWQALDILATRPGNAVHDATALSARFLLQQHDPREAERRRVFTFAAKQQVDLAAQYRARKWLATAAARLDVADRFDRDAGSKERGLLAAAQPKAPAAEPPAAKAGGAAKPQLAPLLQRSGNPRVFGEWREVGECVETAAQTGNEGFLLEWVPNVKHDDHEVVVEWKASDASKDHNGGLWLGFDMERGDLIGHRAVFRYRPEARQYELTIVEYRKSAQPVLAKAYCDLPATKDGFHRFAVQVHGTHLRVQLDGAPAVEATVKEPVRGAPGLFSGIATVPCVPVLFRNFRVDPLPADLPSDEEVRAQAEAATQNAIAKAVETAKELLAKKQPEAAALAVREALARVGELPPGVLRDNLKKTIEPQLAQADPLTQKRTKAAQAIAAELATLADQYTTAGMPRAGLALLTRASSFDPDGLAARLTATREKVVQWNVAQAAARASELAPPADDGTQLREWFAKGRKLDTRSQGMVVEGAAARVDALAPESMVAWLPQPLAATLTKASVHVHLASDGLGGGLCFDVVDATNYGIAFVQRRAKGLRFGAFLQLGGKWVPLLQREIPLDAWRLDGWHKVSVESNETGLVARCGETEIKIARKMMGKATGLFGLYADNAGSAAASVELRAFEPGK